MQTKKAKILGDSADKLTLLRTVLRSLWPIHIPTEHQVADYLPIWCVAGRIGLADADRDCMWGGVRFTLFWSASNLWFTEGLHRVS